MEDMARHIAYHLLEPAPLWTPLHSLYKIVAAWLDSASDSEMRSLLAQAGETRPQEWKQEYRINLHLDHVSKATLHQLMINLLVTEVFYNAWIMDKQREKPPLIDLRVVANPNGAAPVDATIAIAQELSSLSMSDALQALVQAVLLWAYNCDEDLLRENAIKTKHYDETEGRDGLAKHALRSFYMGFTGA